jgi:hypothetical protein
MPRRAANDVTKTTLPSRKRRWSHVATAATMSALGRWPLARSRGGMPSISAALPLLGEPASVGRLLRAAASAPAFANQPR